MNEHSLQQCNNIPTRGNNILDLVFTTNNNLIENITVEDGISDHQAFIVSIKNKSKNCKEEAKKNLHVFQRKYTKNQGTT